MDDFSGDSDSSERIWIKVTPDQARWFSGLNDDPITEDAGRSPAQPSTKGEDEQDAETEGPVELEDLVQIKETAMYQDFEETKTTIIVEGKKQPTVKSGDGGCKAGSCKMKGESGSKSDEKKQGEAHLVDCSYGPTSPRGMGEPACSLERPSSAYPYRVAIKKQSTGCEGSSMDTREGGIERTHRPGREKTEEDKMNQKEMGTPGKTKRSTDNISSRGWDRVRKKVRLD